jgi:hypothetical protein
MTQVALCSSAAEIVPMSKVAVPSLRKNMPKSRTAASRAVASQQTFVAIPVMMTASMPRERRISSRSVP